MVAAKVSESLPNIFRQCLKSEDLQRKYLIECEVGVSKDDLDEDTIECQIEVSEDNLGDDTPNDELEVR